MHLHYPQIKPEISSFLAKYETTLLISRDFKSHRNEIVRFENQNLRAKSAGWTLHEYPGAIQPGIRPYNVPSTPLTKDLYDL